MPPAAASGSGADKYMHPTVFNAFEEICGGLSIHGGVLEIGASPHHQTLLALPALKGAAKRIGVGLDGEAEGDGYTIRQMNSHDLSSFADGSFELVLSNSMLEHDGQFWLTLQEARRVTAPGGYVLIGVPTFGRMGKIPGRKLLRLLSKVPLIGTRWRKASEAAGASSLTLGVHDFPRDYYRFSEQAMTDVLLAGLEIIGTRMIMSPSRVIGLGQKPEGSGMRIEASKCPF